MFYVVQILTRKEHPGDEPSPMAPVRTPAQAFNDRFGVEYMGHSEFEFGIVPEAFRNLRAVKLQIIERLMTRRGLTRPVYLIASADPAAYGQVVDDWASELGSLEEALNGFTSWFSAPYLHTLGETGFEGAFTNQWPRHVQRRNPDTTVWWALPDNVAWTLDRGLAEDFLAAVGQPASAAR